MKKYIIMIILLISALCTLIVMNNKLKNEINDSKEITELRYKDSESLNDKKKELNNSIEAQKIKINELNTEIDSLNKTLDSNKEKLKELEG